MTPGDLGGPDVITKALIRGRQGGQRRREVRASAEVRRGGNGSEGGGRGREPGLQKLQKARNRLSRSLQEEPDLPTPSL